VPGRIAQRETDDNARRRREQNSVARAIGEPFAMYGVWRTETVSKPESESALEGVNQQIGISDDEVERGRGV